MNKLLTLIFALVMLLPLSAEKAVYNDINYTIDPITLTAEVADNTIVGWQAKEDVKLIIPYQITVGQKTFTVTGIADNAFKGCKYLAEVVLPNTLTYLSRNAFEGTGIWLNKDNWNEGVLFIDSCLIATDKTIAPKYIVPTSTRLIAAGAFEGNKSLTRVELPATLKRIDNDLFRNCKNLTKVIIPASVEWIGQDAFLNTGIWLNEKKWRRGALYIDGCLIAVNDQAPDKFIFKDKIPTRLIAAGAFRNAKNVKTVSIPEGIAAIPVACFYQCPSLTEVQLPGSVKRVERFAFANCDKLRDATLPDGLEYLGNAAFSQCRSLKSQHLSDKLMGIPTACFYLCSSLNTSLSLNN